MSDLYFFKFEPEEWLKGNITACDMSAQGIFTNICAHYWLRKGDVNYNDLLYRYPTHTDMIFQLKDRGVLHVENGGMISIHFLDEQMVKFKSNGHDKARKMTRTIPPNNPPTYTLFSPSKEGKQRGEGEGEKKKENSQRKKIENIIPPKLEWIQEFCEKRGNKIDPQMFFHFYKSKGWMVGKNKMKNWHSAMYTWENNDNRTKPQQGSKPKTGFKYKKSKVIG